MSAAVAISAVTAGVTVLLGWWSVREHAKALETARQRLGRMSVKIIPGNHDIDVAVFVSHTIDDHVPAARLRQALLYIDDFVGPQPILPKHRRSPVALRFCLRTFGYFIPREAREPFWNHLLEDRDEMLAQGCRPWVVVVAMSSQIAWIIAAALKDFLAQFLASTPNHR